MNRKGIDILTTLGLLVAFGGLGVGYYLEGGNFRALGGVSALLIIFGGTIGAVIITMTPKDVREFPKTFRKIFQKEEFDYMKAIDEIHEWATIARREGNVALGDTAEEVEDPFTRKGLEYILEGNDYEAIKELLERELEATMERHENGAKPYEQGGGFAPTMGIIGAVMGLVVVLGGLGSSDIDELGNGIAVAFVATLMGIGFANLILLPFAQKLKNKSEEEILYKLIVMEGILGIQRGKNPKLLRSGLMAYLSESHLKDESEKEDIEEG